jgi:hypothetical protein
MAAMKKFLLFMLALPYRFFTEVYFHKRTPEEQEQHEREMRDYSM